VPLSVVCAVQGWISRADRAAVLKAHRPAWAASRTIFEIIFSFVN
jgi:hypothetical protein